MSNQSQFRIVYMPMDQRQKIFTPLSLMPYQVMHRVRKQEKHPLLSGRYTSKITDKGFPLILYLRWPVSAANLW